MRSILKYGAIAIVLVLFAGATIACSPKVGSKEWCEAMKKKDKGKWTADEAKDFAKHCVL